MLVASEPAIRCTSRWPSRSRTAPESTTRCWTTAADLSSTPSQQKCCPLATSAQRTLRQRVPANRDRQRLTRGAYRGYRLAFCVGNEPVSNFRMIERCVVRTKSAPAPGPRRARLSDRAPRLKFRTCVCTRRHYFRDRLLKSFDFTFPFWSVPTLHDCCAARCGSFRTAVLSVAVFRTARTRGRPSTRSQK